MQAKAGVWWLGPRIGKPRLPKATMDVQAFHLLLRYVLVKTFCREVGKVNTLYIKGSKLRDRGDSHLRVHNMS